MNNFNLQQFLELRKKAAAVEQQTKGSGDFIKLPEFGKSITLRIVPHDGGSYHTFLECKQLFMGGKYYSFHQKDLDTSEGRKIYNIARENENDELCKELKGLIPTDRAYAKAIVRGQENEGVKTWSISKTIYSKLIAEMEDGVDLVDVEVGHDIKLFVPMADENAIPKPDIKVLSKPSRLEVQVGEVKPISIMSDAKVLQQVYNEELAKIVAKYAHQ